MAPADRKRLLDPRFKALGYALLHTGGGCFAWAKEFDNGTSELVTDEDGMLPTDPTSLLYIGTYDDEGNEIDCRFCTLPKLEDQHED